MAIAAKIKEEDENMENLEQFSDKDDPTTPNKITLDLPNLDQSQNEDDLQKDEDL